ncbi:uncharacterized protein LOC120703115 isoform X2 [Panicum virgatum]|uniref:uncharacterized protein LOC120703115 isoform X2 n=1 Tax=Panicum virgatum TaxID=38727 RepID=UPI0019D6696D|nr:uncharacterized protein LOC120703115 isoform X2 [Panicum virgatum]
MDPKPLLSARSAADAILMRGSVCSSRVATPSPSPADPSPAGSSSPEQIHRRNPLLSATSAAGANSCADPCARGTLLHCRVTLVAFLPAGAHASPAWPAASKIVIRQCMKSSLLYSYVLSNISFISVVLYMIISANTMLYVGGMRLESCAHFNYHIFTVSENTILKLLGKLCLNIGAFPICTSCRPAVTYLMSML